MPLPVLSVLASDLGQRREPSEPEGEGVSERLWREDSAPLPVCKVSCPEANPMESVWWGLHEAISRNHRCGELKELLGWAEGYLSWRGGSLDLPGSGGSTGRWRGPRRNLPVSIYLVHLSRVVKHYLPWCREILMLDHQSCNILE